MGHQPRLLRFPLEMEGAGRPWPSLSGISDKDFISENDPSHLVELMLGSDLLLDVLQVFITMGPLSGHQDGHLFSPLSWLFSGHLIRLLGGRLIRLLDGPLIGPLSGAAEATVAHDS